MRFSLTLIASALTVAACHADYPDSSPQSIARFSGATSSCNPESYATIDPGSVGGSVVLNSRVHARSMLNQGVFATQKKVTLCKQQNPAAQCIPHDASRVIEMQDAEMTIGIDNGGALVMTLDHSQGTDSAGMNVGTQSGAVTYLKGVSSTTGNAYFVYFLDDQFAGANQPWRKKYFIEVYYLDANGTDYLCAKEMPDHTGGSSNYAGQGGVGGGTEPK